MHCVTDEELRRGLEAVIVGWDRCVVCGYDNDDAHDHQTHPFRAVDVVDLFLNAARDDREAPDGESDDP